MTKLNHNQVGQAKEITIKAELALDVLKDNSAYEKLKQSFKNRFSYESINTFANTANGILTLMLELKGDIVVSLGESEAILSAAKMYEALGFKLDYLPLKNSGEVNLEALKPCDHLFLSPTVTDTFIKTDLLKAKALSKAKIISNISMTLDHTGVDLAILDAYSLTGYATSSLLLHNSLLKEQPLAQVDTVALDLIFQSLHDQTVRSTQKEIFIEALKKELKEDLFFFVDPKKTLDNSLHFGLKGIKAREIIRTLSLDGIFISNGEGCSLGLSRPSTIVQAMGFSEDESRQALILSFNEELEQKVIEKIAKTIGKKYRQIKMLSGEL